MRFLLASVRARVSSFGRYCDVISSAGGEADGDELGVEKVDDVAEEEDEQGIADFIAGRIDAHGKHRWMIRSILKKDRA